MDRKKLKEKFKALKKEVMSESYEFNSFNTDFGKEFETNTQDLLKFVTTISTIPFLLDAGSQLWNQLRERSSKKIQEFKEDLEDKYKEEPDKLEAIRDSFKEDDEEGMIDKILNYVEKTNLLERINSYFFLTFYTYIDLYLMALLQFVISKIDATEVNGFLDGFRPFSNPAERLKIILRNLELDKKTGSKNLDEILKYVSNLENDIWNFIKLRNSIAHKNPLTAYHTIETNFPTIVKNAKVKTKKQLKKTNFDGLEDVINIEDFSLNFEMLAALGKICKNCYIHLVMVDFIISDYFERNNSN